MMKVPKQIKEVFALIPARAGSKGLRKKNIALLQSKPLIAHSIIPALECEKVSRVVVSTDSEEFADMAKDYGAEVPFLRPKVLSGDTIDLNEVILHTINALFAIEKYEPDALLLILPAYPFKSSLDFDRMIQAMNELESDSVMPVLRCECNPYRYFLLKGGCMHQVVMESFGYTVDQPFFMSGANFSLKRLVRWRYVQGISDVSEYQRTYHAIMQAHMKAGDFQGGQINLEYDENRFVEIHDSKDLEFANKVCSPGFHVV